MKFNNIYSKVCRLINKEVILYGIFGVVTTILNIALYQMLMNIGFTYKFSNFITLVIVKLASYVVNKLFVFNSRTNNFIELCKEIFRFVVARGATMLIDYFGLIVLVEVYKFDKLICKYVVTIFIIVVNYFLGKRHVFKNSYVNSNIAQ